MEWENIDVVLGEDGNQCTCRRKDFINLQESCCGFGDTYQEAFFDLKNQERKIYKI